MMYDQTPPPHEPYSYQPPQPPPARRPWWRRPRTFVIIGGSAAVIAALVTVAVIRMQPTPLASAHKACDTAGVALSDGDKTLIVDTKGAEDVFGADVTTATCILQHLNVTSAVLEHIGTTRALDGRQTDQWDGYRAAWTYHPDNGLSITIQLD